MAVTPVFDSARHQTWVVWQLADSAFPTGGFAHSWGLEAAWQSGEVADGPALMRFVHAALGQAGRGALPFLSAAHRGPDRVLELDALSDAFITSTAALGVPLDVAQRLFLFNTVRGIAAAAVRLGIAGSYAAQRLQFDCGPALERAVERCGGLDEGGAAQTAPLLDVLQSAHDRLYSRLFQS
jgi:urease accessory protein